MTTAGAETAALADGARHSTLLYGEVRVGHAELAFGFESLPDASPSHRALYEQAVAAAGVGSEDVLVVRVTEAGIEVDVLDFDDARWPVRTLRVEAGRFNLRNAQLRLRDAGLDHSPSSSRSGAW